MTTIPFPAASQHSQGAGSAGLQHPQLPPATGPGHPPARPPLRLPFFLRTEIDRTLAASMFFSCMLVAFRILHTGSTLFIFMIWNLFLAYIPYALSNWLTRRRAVVVSSTASPLPASPWRPEQPLLHILASLVWLLFLPNSFYILTDLYHLADSRHPRVPEWYDLALIFSFAWNGLLLGILSLHQMEKLIRPNPSVSNPFPGPVAGRGPTWLFVYPIMALNALGIYTGRYLRYNSWDILSNPFRLTGDIAGMITHPFRNRYAWDMILCYTVLLIFIYSMMKKIGRALT